MNAPVLSSCDVSLDTALDQLLAVRWLPAGWCRVPSASELPWRLEQLACRLSAGSWRAYSDGSRLALAIGGSAEGCGVAVRFYDSSARLCAAGVWAPDEAGSWQLREILD